ncbi:nitrate/sulfonate/bicarbonate ABC transporter ATP-binding protein [Mycolicibacterium agri]|uniref:Nitrate/sulfonate/bicarbonate ABC transporter ATP-binding protein n=1 Tax=Mycolicibacterium agri TaxID=36811 RepID=A0A2A7NHD9_MYCAG|nr:ABC transporter ATP-binding protein [Mycolicibacterium agri]PEG43127.1 nitrate/sulfonate/bicarbonate ABC transporter ATP-binding protein [Mycolicibacterium agri]GFG54480.1 nitrate/sulfonate/bicarbonate ABC transporter ATP-binding protein [Mycolicibacterium agri]
MATLVADHVTKIYEPTGRGQTAVQAISDFGFEASGHTFVCLVGPSGCGKSTFLNLVSGVEKPTSGAVTVTGAHKNARIGYVFQDPRLLPWRTVLDNMIYVHDEGDRKTRRQRCMRFLEMVDLAHAADMYPAQLSGGMRQRIGIARALSIEPDLLLMDEPFSHLDAITARSLRTELQELWQASGATVLFVTHDVNEAVQLSDRILMMNKGGTLYADIPINLPRPRLQTDRAVVTQQADVLALFEQMRAEPVGAEPEGANH